MKTFAQHALQWPCRLANTSSAEIDLLSSQEEVNDGDGDGAQASRSPTRANAADSDEDAVLLTPRKAPRKHPASPAKIWPFARRSIGRRRLSRVKNVKKSGNILPIQSVQFYSGHVERNSTCLPSPTPRNLQHSGKALWSEEAPRDVPAGSGETSGDPTRSSDDWVFPACPGGRQASTAKPLDGPECELVEGRGDLEARIRSES